MPSENPLETSNLEGLPDDIPSLSQEFSLLNQFLLSSEDPSALAQAVFRRTLLLKSLKQVDITTLSNPDVLQYQAFLEEEHKTAPQIEARLLAIKENIQGQIAQLSQQKQMISQYKSPSQASRPSSRQA